ncbi:transcription factor bHLH93-like [Hordeum vulgare]|nr:transcription factor bHLH93-like [Hordeum vulgare]
MELDEQAFLEELFSLRRDATAWECNAMGDFFSPACGAAAMGDCFQDRHQPTVSVLPTFTASYDPQHQQHQQAGVGFDCLSEVYGGATPFANAVAGGYGEMGFLGAMDPKAAAEGTAGLGACKVEPGLAAGADGGPFGQGQMSAAPASRKKRVEGMPSKNLMAERRRRKRLNDRLSMLRSVVPKISKMDRTSILGDTIDYMKELLERIRRLQEEMDGPEAAAAAAPLLSVFRELNPNEMLARNTPKFEVERKEGEEGDTRVEIYCAAKPGLLLSTVSTLDTLGLDIQQCVVSCFNDFAMHASCSEVTKNSSIHDFIIHQQTWIDSSTS